MVSDTQKEVKMGKQLTDEQVEQEIESLKNDPHVKLFQANQRLKYKRRQKLYTLRWQKKEGKRLEDSGITLEMIKSMEDE